MSDLKAPAGRVAGTPAKAKPPDPPAAPGVVIRNGRLVAGSALAELRAREQVALDRERELRDGTPVGRPLVAAGTALVGAVQRIDLSDEAQVRRIAKQAQEWQTLAWAYFDVLGPIKYAMRFLSNSLLRVRLFAAVVDPDNPDAPPIPAHEAALPGEPVDGEEARPALLTDAQADEAAEAVARLKVADGGQGQLLADLGICLSIPGEAWLVTDTDADGEEEITVRSDRELIVKGDRVAVRDTPTDKEGRELGPDADLWRLWRRHPAWRGLADSNMRAVLDDCSEFLVLRRMFASMGKSRMNGGALVVSSDASFGRAHVVTPEGVTTPNTTDDPLDVALANYLVMPVGDDTSPANVAPAIIRLKGEFVKDVHWLDFGRKITDAELKRAGDLVTSIAQGLDLPIEVLTGMAASNHWCQDDATEVMTADGWRSHDRLDVGDTVLTLNHETGLAEWQPVLDIYRASVTDELMVRMEGSNHSSLSTPDHRWPVVRPRWTNKVRRDSREMVTTACLTAQHSLVTGAPCADQPTEAKYADDLVELVAWLWTEGNLGASGGATIAQSHTRNPERVARIRVALTRCFGPRRAKLAGAGRPAWRESIQPNTTSFGGPITVFHLNRAARDVLEEVAPGKVVAPSFVRALTPAQLRLFTDVSEMGDGRHYRQGRSDIWQADPRSLDAYEMALVLSGRMITRTEEGRNVSAWPQTTIRPVKAALAPTFTDAGMSIASEKYTGTIWCPTTPNGTWFARRQGTAYFTGNSAWLIDDSLYRSHIYPLLALIAAQLASGAVRPWLRANGWEAADAARIVVGINASELVADPDRSKTADEAHDRMTISDATHRRDKGYGDDDAPDEEELARRMDAKRPAPPFGGGGGDESTEGGPPEDDEATEDEPVVGAGRRRSRGSVGARLGELDRGLMARLSAAAETAMDRALDRAGARLRNLAKKDHVATAALAAAGAVDNPLVAAVVGEQRTAVLVAAADEDLLDGAFDQLEQRFDTWVKRTQQQARTVVGRVGASDADLADLEAEQDEDRTAAWAWLAASMAALARARMFDPNPDVAPLGEVDASVRVPPALMRNALARAGGATPVETATGGVVDVLAGQPVGGVATGDLVRKAFASVGLPWTGYVWDYGDPGARSRPFPPHEDLDQVEFERWDSDVLANSAGEYPHGDFWRPGDHRGCACAWHPVVPDGSAGEPEGGTVTDEATEE